jgi:hypothetical protein
MVVEYWNGLQWRRDGYEYDEDDVEVLIRNGLARGDCPICTSRGYHLCGCTLSSRRDQTPYSKPLGDRIWSLHQDNRYYLYFGKKIKLPIHYSNYYGHMLTQQKEVDLDDVVDNLLLKGEIEIEVSL